MIFRQTQEIRRFFYALKNRKRKALIITDENVYYIYKNLLREVGYPSLVIPAGEEVKSRQEKEKIEDYLFENGYRRDAELVAFGGGVVSDLVGFVASTYMRGVAFSIIPTTVTALADASIGGKTGINTSFGKNLLGTFYLPVDVCIEPLFLKTLDSRLYKEQFSEVVKMGLILDRELFFSRKDPIMRARALKEEVVAIDAKEKGLRQILNFGHTFAHAYEKVMEYKVSHGEAVWKGIYFASLLSYNLKILKEDDFLEIERYFLREGIDVGFSVEVDLLYEAMFLDKKNKGKTPCFILISAIGSVHKNKDRVAHPVQKEMVIKSLREVSGCFVK